MPAGGAPVKSTVQRGLHGRPPAAGHTVAGMIGRGVLWLLGSVVAARRGTLVLGIIAGRIFTPGQFGAVAAALVVVLAFRSLGEFGASRALERYEGDPREIAPAVMTISAVSGAALAAVCFTMSSALAGAAGTAGATPLIRVLAFDILIGGLVAAPAAMLRLHPRGIRRSIADQSGNWLGVALTCWLAFSGHGPLSFGIGLLAGGILRAIMIVVFAPTSLRMGLGRGHLGHLAGSALPLAASGLAMFALLNADQLIVGHLKGAASLGCYALAVSLASWPITLLAEPVLRAAPGSFARLRTSPQLQGSAYLSSAALLASLTLPAGFLLSAMAVPLVHLAYGPEWALVAKALEWLAPLVALRLLCKLTSDYLTEFKGAVSALVFQLVWLAAMIPSVIIWTLVDGIAGAAIAQVVIAGARLLPWYLVETRWLSRGRGQVMRIIVPLAAGLTVAVVVIWVRRVVPDEGVDLGLGALAGLTAVGLLVYRMRSVLAAVQRTAAVSTAWSFARAASPVLEAVIESPGRPMWSGVSQRTQILAPVPALVPAAETEEAGLGRKVRSGARWSMVNTLVLRVANFTVGVVLARTVFGPQAWGLYAISQLVLSVVLSANEMGVSLAVVRWEGDIRGIARTALTLSLASSAALCALLFFFAPSLASFLGSPGATSLIRLLSLCVLIDGFVCVPFSLINREFMQARRLVVEAAGFVVTTAVTLLLAFAHLGAISFAWGNVAGNVVTLIGATVAAPFLVLPGWDRRRARELLKFGMPLAGASLLVLGTLNVDSAIVSATLGPAALGFYQLAFNISSWPVQSISAAARRVSFAGFSRLAGSRELLADGFTKAAAVLVALAIPACVLLITLSEPLIKTIYGARWTPAAESLSLLGVLGLLRVFYELAYDGLAAADRRPTLLVVQGLWLVVLIPVLLVGARTYGINGVSAGHVLVAVLVVGPAFLWSLRRIGITVGALLRRCLRPIIGGILMAVVSLAIIHFAGSGIAGLAAAGAAASLVYVPLILPMRHLIRQSPQEPAEVMAPRAA
jgi:O-antigen/teichoic acid export membrane protein